MASKTYPSGGRNSYIRPPVARGARRYPVDLSGDCDYVQFDSYDYESNRSSGRRGGGSQFGPSNGSVKLYMPNSTPKTLNQQEWESKSFPGEKGMIQKDALRGLTGGGTDIFDIQYGEATKQIALDALLGNFGYDAATAMALSGKQYNPNIEMLYKTPKLRPFDFTFIFAPKNKADSDATDDIIKYFKECSAPRLDGTNKGYMIVPELWRIRYMRGGGGEVENHKMNQFKGCALTGITIQDNPTQDTHMTFTDGTPAITAMSLEFVEVDIITRQNQEEAPGRGF